MNSLRWLARIGGLLICGLFIMFLIGEGGPSSFEPVLLPTVLFIVIAAVGYVLAWRNERLGGLMMMAGGLLQGGYLLLLGGSSDINAALIYALPFLPGLAFYALGRQGSGLAG